MRLLHEWRHKPGFAIGAGNGKGSASQQGAARRGILYHQRVYKKLRDLYASDDATVLIEPWFVQVDNQPTRTMRSPDALILFNDGTGLVVEVKMNWKDGRDEKLLNEYLPIVASAFSLDVVWPLLITGNCRGYSHPPLLGLQQIDEALAWEPGRPTPLLLLP